MKKLRKLLSLFMCTVLVGGGVFLTSCSDDDDNSSPSNNAKVTGITVTPQTESIILGAEKQSVELTATVTAEDGADKTVTWLATAGTLSATTGETVTLDLSELTEVPSENPITVTAKAGDQSAESKITVYANENEKEVLSEMSGTYTIGETKYVIDESGNVTDENGTVIGSVTLNEDGTVEITAGSKTYTVNTDADGNLDMDNITDSTGNKVDVEKVATYTVTFSTDGGSAVDAQTIESGSTATEPTAPTKEGSTFAGWYSDAEFANEYDFAAAVTADITLYAKWTEVTTSTPDPDDDTSTYAGPDSWDFVNQEDSVAWVTAFKANAITNEGDGTRSLSADIAIRGANDKATLTLLKDATSFDTKAPSYSYIDPELGMRIKYAGMKIAGVKGEVVLKIKWVGGANRALKIYQGADDETPFSKDVDTEKTQTVATNGSTQTKTLAVYEQDDIEKTLNLATATDIYIDAGNNIYIKSVEIVPTTASVTGVTLDADSASILVGGTKTLTATVAPANATDKTVTWSTSNPNVATVSEGVVTGVAAGDATITVKTVDGEFTATCAISVTATKKPVTSLSVKNGENAITALTLKDSDEAVALTAVYEPADTTDTITWSSSNTDVATVENGVVTPVAVGSTTVTVKANDDVSATVSVTVNKTPVSSVTISGATTVDVNGETTLTATVLPANATNKTVTWSIASGATATEATIDATTGVLTAGTVAGKVSVIATAGDVPSAAYEVTVTEPETVYDLAKYAEDGKATISLGKTNIGTIADDANEGGAAYLSVSTNNWNSSDTIGGFTDTFYNLNGARALTATVKGVAAFDLYVKNSTAGRTFTVKIGEGDAETITHSGSGIVKYTFNTGTTDQIDIVIGGGSASVYPGYLVVYNTAQTIAAESVTIGGKPASTLVLSDGTSYTSLTATVSPARQTEGAVSWTSSNTSVATIDASTGAVTLVAAGTTTITATVGSVSDSFELTVAASNIAVTGISVKDSSEATSGTIYAGDTLTLTATVTPEDATNSNVTWSSTSEEVATVADGVVTGVAAGSATIKATATDGSEIVGEYAVTVKAVTTATYFNFSTKTYSAEATVVGSGLTASEAVWTSKTVEADGVTTAYYDVTKITADKNSGSVYGAYYAGDLKYTSEEDSLWVSIPINVTTAGTLKNVTGKFYNNKTDEVQMVIYVDDVAKNTIASSSKCCDLKLTEAVELTTGNHTIKVALQGVSEKTNTKTGAKLELNTLKLTFVPAE